MVEIRVIIFDDNEKIRNSLALMFSGYEHIHLVDSFATYDDIVNKINRVAANLVIMDIEIPPKDGIEAVTEIRKAGLDIPVLMFTVFEDDEKIFNSICAGAQGYLLKNSTPEILISSIEDLMTGGAPMTPSIARRILKKFSEEIQPPKAKDEYNLTKRELEILKLLTLGKSYKAISAECNISYETVRTHIRNIYMKLHVTTMSEAVAKALNERLIKD